MNIFKRENPNILITGTPGIFFLIRLILLSKKLKELEKQV